MLFFGPQIVHEHNPKKANDAGHRKDANVQVNSPRPFRGETCRPALCSVTFQLSMLWLGKSPSRLGLGGEWRFVRGSDKLGARPTGSRSSLFRQAIDTFGGIYGQENHHPVSRPRRKRQRRATLVDRLLHAAGKTPAGVVAGEALETPVHCTGGGRRTHGRTGSKEYRAWLAMRERCSCPRYQGYSRYGGRGIRVCQRWEESFQDFFRDIGPAPSPQHSLGRIDNDGNYEPSNVAWQSAVEQARNRAKPRRRQVA